MECQGYIQFLIKIIPQEIIDHYNLMPKVKSSYVYAAIACGMYGLPKSGRLANNLLCEHLDKYGYFEMPCTPGLWQHCTRPVWFSLIVDDFGTKYIGEENARHLISALKQNYTMEVDWKGELRRYLTCLEL